MTHRMSNNAGSGEERLSRVLHYFLFLLSPGGAKQTLYLIILDYILA